MSVRTLFPVLLTTAVGIALVATGLGTGADEKPVRMSPAAKDLQPRVVTIQDKAIPLSKALKAVREQTKIDVADRRQNNTKDPVLRLNLDKATFWQALDAVAREADLRVSLHEKDVRIALIDHEDGYREMPTSCNGLFRVTLKRLTAVRFLDADAHFCTARLEVAWEPGFQAFLIETRPGGLTIQDDRGRIVDARGAEKGQASVNNEGPCATEIDVSFPAPQRTAVKLGLFKGSLAVVGSGKMLEFTFNDLAAARTKSREVQQEGVKVTLSQFSGKDKSDLWTFGLKLDYPAGGPNFESFQSWVVNNQAYLENKAGKRFPANGGYETVDQSANQAILRYRFVDEGNFTLGAADTWKLVYRTPGQISEVLIPFEFKDVPLP